MCWRRRWKKIDVCEMEELGTKGSSEKTNSILGGRRWP